MQKSLKHDDIVLLGYPRSGNNYLWALIVKNFFAGEFKHAVSYHLILDEFRRDKKYICVVRNIHDALRSFFTARYMFRLNIHTFSRFAATSMKEVFDPDVGAAVRVTRGGESEARYTGSDNFVNADMTPIEFYALHYVHHLSAAMRMKNLLMVSYDRLLREFDQEMRRINRFLTPTCTKNSYENIEETVGYIIL